MQRFVLVPLLTIAGLAVLSFLLWLTSGPTITPAPTTGAIGGGRSFTVDVAGPRNGLKSLKVTAVQNGKKVDVVAKTYPAAPSKAREVFTLAQAGLKDGPFTLQLSANGSTLFNVRSKTTVVVYAFVYESTPPVVAVLSTAHNIIRGGAGLVTYTVSKEVEKTGVVFGSRFFPGYKQEGGFYACLFPFPWNMTPDQYVPRVIAVDRAGNERIVGLNFNLLPKTFSTDQINLTDTLLDKLSVEFKNKFPQAKTPLEIFLKANGELREQNRKALYEYGKQTSPVPLWEGDFLRMPNTAPLGGFAQTRTYLYQGQKVDEQTHLGFDLASVIHAPVPAANRGKVVFAGDLGIYGQCVVIDHGLGLQTLYAHLSQMSVKAGEMVERGQTIGNTGSTGMAAGDHLHYGVTISGEEVNPVEWWDGHWIKDNVSSKLEAAKGSSPRNSSRSLRRGQSRDHAMPTVVGLLIGIAAGAGDFRTVSFR